MNLARTPWERSWCSVSVSGPKRIRAPTRSPRRTWRRRRRSYGTRTERWRRWKSGIRCECRHGRMPCGAASRRDIVAGNIRRAGVRARTQVEIKVYKQKVKHLLYEHQNSITSLKIDSETALKMQLVRTTRANRPAPMLHSAQQCSRASEGLPAGAKRWARQSLGADGSAAPSHGRMSTASVSASLRRRSGD